MHIVTWPDIYMYVCMYVHILISCVQSLYRCHGRKGSHRYAFFKYSSLSGLWVVMWHIFSCSQGVVNLCGAGVHLVQTDLTIHASTCTVCIHVYYSCRVQTGMYEPCKYMLQDPNWDA